MSANSGASRLAFVLHMAAVMMKTIEANLLEAVIGGAGASRNSPKLSMSDGCPEQSAENDALAKTWNKRNGVTKGNGGNFTKLDGPTPNLYRYEYFTGSRCAPGASD